MNMKSTGVVRQVDPLGRVVIPMELRKTRRIDVKDSLEIFVDGDKIILKKYEPACVFCGEAEDVSRINGKNICQSCRDELREEKIMV